MGKTVFVESKRWEHHGATQGLPSGLATPHAASVPGTRACLGRRCSCWHPRTPPPTLICCHLHVVVPEWCLKSWLLFLSYETLLENITNHTDGATDSRALWGQLCFLPYSGVARISALGPMLCAPSPCLSSSCVPPRRGGSPRACPLGIRMPPSRVPGLGPWNSLHKQPSTHC